MILLLKVAEILYKPMNSNSGQCVPFFELLNNYISNVLRSFSKLENDLILIPANNVYRAVYFATIISVFTNELVNHRGHIYNIKI